MNRSAKRQNHEKARKRHRQELEAHAREAAKRPRAKFPTLLLALALGVMLVMILGIAFWR